jgi:23S rRNA-/tRNA-specific pseudouridylate synthase
VHFKAIHHPVVADSLYASTQPKLLGFKRLALHARVLSFKDIAGKKISVEAPYPEDFERAAARFSL